MKRVLLVTIATIGLLLPHTIFIVGLSCRRPSTVIVQPVPAPDSVLAKGN
jgi:hypothetical protein